MLKKLLLLFAFCAFAFSLFFGLNRFVHKATSGFCAIKIASSYPFRSDWEVVSTPEEKAAVANILSQSFTFLAKGSQAYAFVSGDGKYVLKFFKQHKLRPNSWFATEEEKTFKKEKRESTFQSALNAYTALREETACVHLHFNRTSDLPKRFSLYDKHGKKWVIDLNKTMFLIQKKAEMVYPRISRLMSEGNKGAAEASISTLFALLRTFREKGVVDNDPILRRNFGFCEDKAVQIDIGKLRLDLAYEGNHIESHTSSFKRWLEATHPDLLPHFEEEIGFSNCQ